MSVFGDDSNSNIMAFTISANGQKLLIVHNVKNRNFDLNLNGAKLGKNIYTSYSLNEYRNDLEKDANGIYTKSKENTYSINGDVLSIAAYSTVIFEVE